MKILLISTCEYELSEYEFVNPIVEIIKSFEYDIINCKNLETGNFSIFDNIIICGTSLQDNDYMNYLDDFQGLHPSKHIKLLHELRRHKSLGPETLGNRSFTQDHHF